MEPALTWSQNYAPLGSIGLSALVALLPVATLLGLLAFWHVRAEIAALAGLVAAAVIAMGVYHMPPALTLASALYGAAFGLFPIGWIIVNALFIYALSVETGQFAVLQRQVAGVSGDRRVQALLIAFSFGAFIEGAAGFGAPIAISGALLIGLGFRPLEAAKLALIGNTAPVAYGALSAMVGRQLPFFSVIVPFWLIWAQAGWRGMKEVWPACLITGASFGLTQFVVSNYHGPWLVDIVGAFVSMGALVLFMKVWKPRRIEAAAATSATAGLSSPTCPAIPEPAKGEGLPPDSSPWRAWIPWLLLSLFVFLWGLPPVKTFLNGLFTLSFDVPWLHQAILRVPPVSPRPEPESAVFTFNALSATGTALLGAGILAGFALGLGPLRILRLYGTTLLRLRASLVTIALMLALGFTTRYSGTDTTMGLALASTGFLFPFFSPLIGWLGVALTGSDTSSNVLFGNLQRVTAQQLGLSPILMAASNSSGGVMGKMIDAQSIVVASVATGGHRDSPDAGTILRSVFWHSLALAVLMGFLVLIQAYLWTSVVPPG